MNDALRAAVGEGFTTCSVRISAGNALAARSVGFNVEYAYSVVGVAANAESLATRRVRGYVPLNVRASTPMLRAQRGGRVRNILALLPTFTPM